MAEGGSSFRWVGILLVAGLVVFLVGSLYVDRQIPDVRAHELPSAGFEQVTTERNQPTGEEVMAPLVEAVAGTLAGVNQRPTKQDYNNANLQINGTGRFGNVPRLRQLDTWVPTNPQTRNQLRVYSNNDHIVLITYRMEGGTSRTLFLAINQVTAQQLGDPGLPRLIRRSAGQTPAGKPFTIRDSQTGLHLEGFVGPD
jgi:hypothetical protein